MVIDVRLGGWHGSEIFIAEHTLHCYSSNIHPEKELGTAESEMEIIYAVLCGYSVPSFSELLSN